MREQKFAQNKYQDKATNQHGQEYQDRAFFASDYGDETGEEGNNSADRSRQAGDSECQVAGKGIAAALA